VAGSEHRATAGAMGGNGISEPPCTVRVETVKRLVE
jgi:hypothetical protein